MIKLFISLSRKQTRNTVCRAEGHLVDRSEPIVQLTSVTMVTLVRWLYCTSGLGGLSVLLCSSSSSSSSSGPAPRSSSPLPFYHPEVHPSPVHLVVYGEGGAPHTHTHTHTHRLVLGAALPQPRLAVVVRYAGNAARSRHHGLPERTHLYVSGEKTIEQHLHTSAVPETTAPKAGQGVREECRTCLSCERRGDRGLL